MASRENFRLDKIVTGVLGSLCQAYHMDASWLAWQYERHVFTKGASPFQITTADYANPIKDDIAKVNFTIEFDKKNGNLVKWIKFEESPSRKIYVITQTSIKHMSEERTCPLWLELPKGAGRSEDLSEDIGAIKSLVKMQVCCAEWRDFLPSVPQTALEHAQLSIAIEDVDWMQRLVVRKGLNSKRLADAVSDLSSALQKKEAELNAAVAKNTSLQDDIENLKEDARVQEKILVIETKAKSEKTKADTIVKLRAEGKVKDKLVANLQSQLEVTKKRADTLDEIIAKLEAELKDEREKKEKSVAEQSGSEFEWEASPTKKRKMTSNITFRSTPKTPTNGVGLATPSRTAVYQPKLPNDNAPQTVGNRARISPTTRTRGGGFERQLHYESPMGAQRPANNSGHQRGGGGSGVSGSPIRLDSSSELSDLDSAYVDEDSDVFGRDEQESDD